MKKDLLRARLKQAGERVGVKVYPHRLRHTCATQLLNAGCRITSIQRFLGHKELGTTMVYARVHDQTVAEDYFKAMQKVEQSLAFPSMPNEEPTPQEFQSQEISILLRQLVQPELLPEEQLSIVARLRKMLGTAQSHSPPKEKYEVGKVLCNEISEVLVPRSAIRVPR